MTRKYRDTINAHIAGTQYVQAKYEFLPEK